MEFEDFILFIHFSIKKTYVEIYSPLFEPNHPKYLLFLRFLRWIIRNFYTN